MIALLIALSLSIPAQEGKFVFPNELETSLMLSSLFKNDVSAKQEIFDRFYRFPESPWPEHVQAVLLDILNRFYMYPAFHQKWDLISSWCLEGECLAQALEMAIWQEDVKFAPFIAQELGSGWLAVNGMADLGEVGFPYVLAQLNKEGQGVQWGAAMTIRVLLERSEPFLNKGVNRDLAREGLIRMAGYSGGRSRLSAISVLQHFDESEVVALLTTMSRNDPFTLEGRFPVRLKAQEALKFIAQRKALLE